MERYITTGEVSDIMTNLDQLEAFKCLGEMSNYVTRYEQDMIYRDRWRGKA